MHKLKKQYKHLHGSNPAVRSLRKKIRNAVSAEKEAPLQDELNQILLRAGVIETAIEDSATAMRLIGALAQKRECYIDDLLAANETNAGSNTASAKSKYYVEDLPHKNRLHYHPSCQAISKHKCCLTFDDGILLGHLNNLHHRMRGTQPADRHRRHKLRKASRIHELNHGKSSLRQELKPEDI